MSKYLLDGHKLKYHPVEVAKFYKGETVYPIYVEISPTASCNHRCIFCNYNYLGHVGKFHRQRMISLMEELGKAGVKSIVFAGIGEPFLHEDTIYAIQKAKSVGIDVAASTNGALLGEKELEIIARNLTWIRFSFSGGNPENYAKIHNTKEDDYHTVINNVKKLVRIKNSLNSEITIGIQFILLPGNKEYVISTGEMFKEIGVDYFVVKHFYQHPKNKFKIDETFRTEKLIDTLKEKANELTDNSFHFIVRDLLPVKEARNYNKCYGLEFIAYVREDGEVYTCFSHQEDKNTSLGNIIDNSFEKVWNSPEKKRAIDYINEKIDKNSCQQNCRHHQINNYLWDLKNPGIHHINFI